MPKWEDQQSSSTQTSLYWRNFQDGHSLRPRGGTLPIATPSPRIKDSRMKNITTPIFYSPISLPLIILNHALSARETGSLSLKLCSGMPNRNQPLAHTRWSSSISLLELLDMAKLSESGGNIMRECTFLIEKTSTPAILMKITLQPTTKVNSPSI